MPLADADRQFDESWAEQDKIRRRKAIKERLKIENLHKRYSPFRQLDGVIFSDPAIERYSALRKYGRMPGAPWSPTMFFSMCAMVFGPIYIVSIITGWEREPYLKKLASGEISYEEKSNLLVT